MQRGGSSRHTCSGPTPLCFFFFLKPCNLQSRVVKRSSGLYHSQTLDGISSAWQQHQHMEWPCCVSLKSHGWTRTRSVKVPSVKYFLSFSTDCFSAQKGNLTISPLTSVFVLLCMNWQCLCDAVRLCNVSPYVFITSPFSFWCLLLTTRRCEGDQGEGSKQRSTQLTLQRTTDELLMCSSI